MKTYPIIRIILSVVIYIFGLQLASFAINPTAVLSSPTISTSTVGAIVTVTGTATDQDGTMTEHWLEVRRPAGDWSWEGWLTGEPWGPQLVGSSYSSTKTTTFTLSTVGNYTFRTTAYDPTSGQFVISNEQTVIVSSTNTNPSVNLSSPNIPSAPIGTVVTVTGTASDPDGSMTEHWLEVRRPAGDWSWEGWLTGEPWGPQLVGSSYSSTKTTTFTLSTVGNYTFRTTAYDPMSGQFVISNEQTVYASSSPVFLAVYVNHIGPYIQFNAHAYATDITAFSATKIIHANGTIVLLPLSTGDASHREIWGQMSNYDWYRGLYPLSYTIHLSTTTSSGTYTKDILVDTDSPSFSFSGY